MGAEYPSNREEPHPENTSTNSDDLEGRLWRGMQVDFGNQNMRGEVLRAICLGARTLHEIDEVDLHRAVVVGILDLSDTIPRKNLRFVGCDFRDGIDLSGARIDGSVEFVDCTMPTLQADGLFVRANFKATHCRTAASFRSAEIGGDLRFTGSSLFRPDGVALDGAGLAIRGTLYLDGELDCYGQIILEFAHIQMNLDCTGGRFIKNSGIVLRGDGLVVDGTMFLNGLDARGEIQLQEAVAHALRLDQSTIVNLSGRALAAKGIATTAGIHLDGFRAEGQVELVGARIGGDLSCTRGAFKSRARAIDAERLVAREVRFDRGFTAEGEVNLAGAVVDNLDCRSGRFSASPGSALRAESLSCRSSVYLDDGFVADGCVSFKTATIGGNFVCSGGSFGSGRRGLDALDARGVTIGGAVRMDDGFHAAGGVRLAQARVGHRIDCTGGRFVTPDGVALDLSGATCDGDILLRVGKFSDRVCVRGASVGRDLDFSFSQLGSCVAFDAHGLYVGGTLHWTPDSPPKGEVDLSFATVSTLRDDERSWQGLSPNLVEFKYDRLDSVLSVFDRLSLFERMRPFSRQPYRHLSQVFRTAGAVREADFVAIAGHRAIRRKETMRLDLRISNWFQDVIVGFGYRPYRPAMVIAACILFGTPMFYIAGHLNTMRPSGQPSGEMVTSAECTSSYPCFSPLPYTIELFIPLIDLGQVNNWRPDPSAPGGVLVSGCWYAARFIGWLAAAGLGAALGSAIGRMSRNE